MKATRPIAISCALALILVAGTGCFRVSSDTRALRDAALDAGFAKAEEKIEFGVGFFTVGLARFASKYVDIPPEARTALASLKHAECAVYEVRGRQGGLSSILHDADEAMARRGCERLVGVLHENELVAVYVPRQMDSARDLTASVLVLNREHLVCATARANAEDLIQLAMGKLSEEMGSKRVASSF